MSDDITREQMQEMIAQDDQGLLDIEGKSRVLVVRLNIDNDAFQGDSSEAARVLRNIADQVAQSRLDDLDLTTMKARDLNGNTVATANVALEEL